MPKSKNIANKDKKAIHQSRPLFLKSEIKDVGDDLTVYGQVTEVLGSCNFNILCYDGQTRLCHLRSSIKKQKEKVEKDGIVIVGLRDFDNKKGDIIYVYKKIEIPQLRTKNEIPKFISQERFQENYDEILEDTFDFESI